MRRDSLLLLGLLTTVCMIAGVVGGIQSGRIFGGPLQASPTAPIGSVAGPSAQTATPLPASNLQPTVSTQQMALLVIGISNRDTAHLKFEGCWIVAFSPGINKYYVAAFPPEASFRLNGAGPEQTLAEIYAEGVQQDLGYVFVRDAIQSVLTAMSIQAGVTLDRSDVASWTANLGGISVGTRLLLGTSLVTAYDTESLNGTAARLDFQKRAIQALFQALGERHWTPDSVAVYLEQLPHAVRPEDIASLNNLAHSAPALQNSELIWTAAGGIREATAVP